MSQVICNRTTPIVQMRLLMDNSRLPITCKLFEGNTNDSTTLITVLDELKANITYKNTFKYIF